MALAARGLPVKRLYVGEDRASRAYLGDQLVFADQELGVVGAPRVALIIRAVAPNVYPGVGAVVARISLTAHAPAVTAASTVRAVRAAIVIAARPPDIPKVVAAPAAAITVSALAPTYRQTTDLYVVAAAITVTAIPPVVGTAVAAVAASVLVTAVAPTLTVSSSITVVAASLVVAAPAPAYRIGVPAVAAALTVAAIAPTLSTSSSVTAVAAGITIQARVPTVGTAVAPPAAAITLSALAPTASASSSVTAVAAAITTAAPAPSVAAGSAVTAPAAAITTTAPAPTIVTGIQLADDFNRADGALGASWAAAPTAMVIATNRAQAGTPTGANATIVFASRHTTALMTDNQEVTAVLVASTALPSTSLYGGVFLRSTTGDNRVEGAVISGTATIFTFIGGSRIQRATASAPSSPTSMRLTAVGNVYSLYVNGSATPSVTWTDSGALISIGSSNRSVGVFSVAQTNGIGTPSARGYAIDSMTAADI